MSHKLYFLIKRIFFFFFLSLGVLALCYAEENEVNKIIDLKIEGNKTVSQMFILSCVSSKIGQQFSSDILNDDVRRLYKTGRFEDVEAKLLTKEKGVQVIIKVEEKPVLTDIIVQGNRIFSKRYIKKRLGFEAKSLDEEGFLNKPLNKVTLKRKIRELKILYRQRGYYLAEVEEKIDIDFQLNQATVHILINEKKKIRICNISVEGNREFSDKRILKLLKTKRKGWLNSGFFKDDVFKKDLEKVKEFYRNAGYSDAKVGSIISYDGNMEKMFIILNIKENDRYEIGRLIISGNKFSSEKEIKEGLELLPGIIFTDKKLRKDVRSVERLYFDKGYISCFISPKTLLNKKTNKIDVLYQIEEGLLTYVNRVDIKGNAITKDAVIRRELKIFPADRFDGKKLEQSYQNLRNLDYFEEGGIKYNIKDTAISNKKDLIFEVKEKKTGEFSFGGGYSSIDKTIGFIEISQRNFDINNFPTFRGGGQNLRLQAEIGRKRKDYLLSFTEPWFGGKPLSLGFDLYNRSYEREEYDEGRLGGNIRMGKAFSDIWRWNLTYCLEEVKINDIGGVSLKISDITEEEGKNIISSLTTQITRDTRDSRIDPHGGNIFINSVKFAGLGGDKKFAKHIIEMTQYVSSCKKERSIPVFANPLSNLVLELRLKGGIINDWNNAKVPLYERFYAGGAGTIRGYKYRKVGPLVYGEPVGGNAILIGGFELSFPLVKRIIKGAFFYDIGNVWAKPNDIAVSDLKGGAGAGIRINTPIGPLKLDYGYGFDPDFGEKKDGHFYFSMGRRF
ncbi:MAG: outer membrane protein assembly factor BamA [Candidatus Omnitrophica bacterium]|nr:outer membrane protein assembly factor BamA [Candidatus Omnitrophota bacterium]